MNLRTLCSAISCVVALTFALPGHAETTPTDVRGALEESGPLLVAKQSTQMPEYEEVISLANAPQLHIEELRTMRIGTNSDQYPNGYDTKYLADFQEALTAHISEELERKIQVLAW